jgi:hypothetical protein
VVTHPALAPAVVDSLASPACVDTWWLGGRAVVSRNPIGILGLLAFAFGGVGTVRSGGRALVLKAGSLSLVAQASLVGVWGGTGF